MAMAMPLASPFLCHPPLSSPLPRTARPRPPSFLTVHCNLLPGHPNFSELWTQFVSLLHRRPRGTPSANKSFKASIANRPGISSPDDGAYLGSSAEDDHDSHSLEAEVSHHPRSSSHICSPAHHHQHQHSRTGHKHRSRSSRHSRSHRHEIYALLLQLGIAVLFMRATGLLVPPARIHQRATHAAECTCTLSRTNVTFSEFMSRVQQGHVQSVQIDGACFTYTLRSDAPMAAAAAVDMTEEYGRVFLDHEWDPFMLAHGEPSMVSRKVLYTTIKPVDMSPPYEDMLRKGVEVHAPDKRLTNYINEIGLPFLYFGVLAILSDERFQPSSLQRSTGWRHILKKCSKRGRQKNKNQKTTFADVAGVDEAKEELEEVVDFLRDPGRYIRLGAHLPRGVLLVGPPGTGKTLIAKAVAGEAEVPFFSCSGSEFVELYVGMGAVRVRELFAKARKEAPCIIFIDEIDSVAKIRDGRLSSFGNDEREQTLIQLLTELDGFERSSMVIVLAATNRADILDPALRRPGRFDRIVMVEPPDKKGREQILAVHIQKRRVPLAQNVDLGMVVASTSGFTGADLANLVNEAAFQAARAEKEVVGSDDFTYAIERIIGGIEKKRSVLHASEKGVVARHEVGHAVVGTAIANLLPGCSRVQKLSILRRTGGALGFTYSLPASGDRYLVFVDELRGRLVALLGGRAAEEIVYHGRVSTGAIDDIRQATDMAYKAIAEYGLNSFIGPVSLATLSGGGLDTSGAASSWAKDQGHMTDLVQQEVQWLLQSALSMALIVIRSNPSIIEGLGAQLEANDKVEGEILQQWLNQVVTPVELTAFVQGKHIFPMSA